MNWDDMRLFDAVAARGSLTAAARHLGLSVATMSRRLSAFEHETGLLLLARSPSGIRLTAEGEALRERSRIATGAMEDAARLAASLRRRDPRIIRISATEPIAAEVLAPSIPGLIRRHPDIRIDIRVSMDVVSLGSGQTDIALRFAKPVGDGLIVARLPSFALGLFAGHLYLDGRKPASLDLFDERLISYDDSYGPIEEVAWIKRSGLSSRVVFRSSSTRALLNACRAGAGIALLPEAIARGYPDLTPVPAPFPIARRSLWMMSHRDFARNPHHRQVKRWIVGALKNYAAIS